MSQFIPAFHRVPPADKLQPKFCLDVINYYVRNTRNYNLLWDKKVFEIDGYAKGEFDLRPFKRMFKSDADKIRNNVSDDVNERTNINGLNNNKTAIGFDYECYPLIPDKLNSAEAIVQKKPLEITCKAFDPLAIEKKKSDINFLVNKPKVEAQAQDVADALGIEKIDIGTTQHSATDYSQSPFGLDLQDPEQLAIFENLLYALKIESAFETGLQIFNELKNISNIKLLEIKDQLKYAVSVNRAFQNALTGLPDAEYIWPGDMETPWSELPDMSDNSHRIQTKFVTPNQLWDFFGDEIGKQDQLLDLMNNKDYGYCTANNQSLINRGNLDTFKIILKQVEVKSIDWVGVTSDGFITNDETKSVKKIWAQNTYSFWWLNNTKHVFGIKRLPFATRTKGQESYQNFSTNIYKSHQKSTVELSIGENKKAQIADIKLTHALIKSLPPGKGVDLRFLRNTLSGLKDEQSPYTLESLINLAMEQNQVLIDTEGFDGKNDGQFKPTWDIPGGLKQELVGYTNVIIQANNNISRITGINQQLTGESANPEGLVGMQKLLINSSLNSLYYCSEAMTQQYQKLFSVWASVIQTAIEEGGEPKEAIIRMIGAKKANIIDGLDDIGLHQIGVFVKVSQREEERARFEKKKEELEYKGVLSSADVFLLDSIDNPRDKYAVLAVKEVIWQKKQDQIRKEQMQAQQAIMKQQGQNTLAAQAAETEGNIKEIYAKGDVQAKIVQLAAQLNMSAVQLDGIIKGALQQSRNKGGIQKTVANNVTKNTANEQPAIV